MSIWTTNMFIEPKFLSFNPNYRDEYFPIHTYIKQTIAFRQWLKGGSLWTQGVDKLCGSWVSGLILIDTMSSEMNIIPRKLSYFESCWFELWWGWVGFAEKVWVSLPKLWSKEILVLLNVKVETVQTQNTKTPHASHFFWISRHKKELIACLNWKVCMNKKSLEILLIFEYPLIMIVTRLYGRRRSVTFWVVA